MRRRELTVHSCGPEFPAAATTTRPPSAARFAPRDMASVPSEHCSFPSERLTASIP
jgi:hypothetical protein